MKNKIREFFVKLNNSYILVAICTILIAVIALGSLIDLVAQPFETDMTYSAKIETKTEYVNYRTTAKLLLLENGRYSLTIHDGSTREELTTFGDYGYGKVTIRDDDYKRLHDVIWFDRRDFSPFDDSLYVLKSPFKLEYEGLEFTCGEGIALLVIYCAFIAASSAIATILLIKRKKGKTVFTDRLRIVRRLKDIETKLEK